ncbi:MAG: ATP-binding cassette domain-containing protein, partial [Verrucomicrobiae bacterium]|nr:ATP-binding cassette domain-containing protein [Verrucomicrobiae bacterium]
IGRLHGLNQMLQSARAAAARVFDILDAEDEHFVHQRAALREEPQLNKAESLPLTWRARGEVEYRNVSFDYGPGKVALRDISFRVKPGEMIALVGPTGSGKSTLASLLPAFYEVNQGAVLIDGYDVRDIPLPILRAQISMVSQEPFLFNGTLRENIAFGRPEATDEEIILAARAANCDEFIERLPDGYESPVGERGVRLSVGEKQRVSIARAILKNAPILVLDEATASVDTATEQLIQQALERLLAGRTSIVIAHRLSTVARANQILVMLRGRIIERGTHEELLARGGLYARLAHIQNTLLVEEGL